MVLFSVLYYCAVSQTNPVPYLHDTRTRNWHR